MPDHVKAVAPVLLVKCLTDRLQGRQRAYTISLSARAGSIADNRLGGWYGYRAIKAARNMVMKTAAIALRRLALIGKRGPEDNGRFLE